MKKDLKLKPQINKKRIALHYHIPISLIGEKIYCPSYYGVWIDSLAKYFDEVVLIAHTSNKVDKYKIKSKNIKIIDLGTKSKSLLFRLIKFRQYQKKILNDIDSFDCLGIRGPTPLAIFIYWIARKKPIFFFLVGNLWRITWFSDLSFLKKILLTFYWWVDHQLLSIAANRSVTFALTPYFKKEFPLIKNIKVHFSSTIYKKDIKKEIKTYSYNNPLEIIFIGRVEFDKGIEYVIEALNYFKNTRDEIIFNIVGDGDKNYIDKLKSKSKLLGIDKNVRFKGYIAHGKVFKNIIDKSNLMIIPSIYDFQTRAIWEGMSRGLPILVSDGIKGLPLIFKDKKDVYFFKSKNVKKIAEAISEIKNNKKLYSQLSKSSLRIAEKRTIELSAEILIKEIKKSKNFEKIFKYVIN